MACPTRIRKSTRTFGCEHTYYGNSRAVRKAGQTNIGTVLVRESKPSITLTTPLRSPGGIETRDCLSSIEPNEGGDKLEGSPEVPGGHLTASGDFAKLLLLGEESLDQMGRTLKLSVVVARQGPVGRGGITAVSPAAASGSTTRVSASNPLSAMLVAARDGATFSSLRSQSGKEPAWGYR